jgi:hypothetical protein
LLPLFDICGGLVVSVLVTGIFSTSLHSVSVIIKKLLLKA